MAKTQASKSAKGSNITDIRSNRSMVPRNIRNIMKNAKVKRAAKGVGLAVYDTNVAPTMAAICTMANFITQLRGRRTITEAVMHQACEIVLKNKKLNCNHEIAYRKKKK
jgi:hypothetical protein